MMMQMPNGSIQKPLVSALRCLASCRKTGSTKNMPIWPMASALVVISPYRNPRWRSCPNSKSGLRSWRSFHRSSL